MSLVRPHSWCSPPRTAALLAAMVLIASPASAFDTGPHWDITADVLRSEGFSPEAIKTVQCANFFVDFYEFIGNGGIAKVLDGSCRKKVEKVLKIGDAQHFDDLGSTIEVSERWDAMVEATQGMAGTTAKSKDILGLLALLGASLHNVQDFYAHSNWVEPAPMGPGIGKGALAKYGDHPTWLSVDRADRMNLEIYTKLNRPSQQRTHGDWNSDSTYLNKDWQGRPYHRDAYICAWFATRQWVRLFQGFVNDPAVWLDMQKANKTLYNPDRDWDYSRKISFYGGHWNGNGGPTDFWSAFKSETAATAPDLLFPAVLDFMKGNCITAAPSELRRTVEDLLLTWGDAPFHKEMNVALPSAAPESLQFVRLQVNRIENKGGDDGFLGGQMDWYGKAAIAGQTYMTGLIDEHDNFDFERPGKPYASWTMTKALRTSVTDVPIYFQLWELDYSDDDLVDVNPKSGMKTLVFGYSTGTDKLSGDLTGARPWFAEGKGDCDCARLKMNVDRRIASCLR
jgi:hypothetical protein